jgi:hypothetical protein
VVDLAEEELMQQVFLEEMEHLALELLVKEILVELVLKRGMVAEAVELELLVLMQVEILVVLVELDFNLQ